MNPNQQIIESLLFYKNEPVTFSWLSSRMKMTEEKIKTEVHEMLSYYDDRGISLLVTIDEVSLVSSESGTKIISELVKSNEEKELSKQALETLAVVAYKGKVTKSELDYIRGVNSIFILRNLLIRGLIIKLPNSQDKRSPLYSISHDLLSYLGLHQLKDLPNYEEMVTKLRKLEDDYHNDEGNNDSSIFSHD